MGAAKGRRTGAQILVDQLKVHGADTVFCVPGESYLAVLDALYDANSIRLVTCRQEGGAAMMADAYGKLTGTPGLCMVTRGPGATNASAGLHVAMQDSTPLILFIGQVARDTVEREAFQEVDYRRMLGQFAKWVAQIDDPRRIPEFLSRAYHVATSGRPGPVVLALPEDMLTEAADVADAEPYRPVETWPGEAPMAALRERLAAARRPFLLLGGSAWDAKAVTSIEAFATANKLPVGTVFRRQDRFDNAHPCYAGDVGIGINPKLAQRIQDADLLIAVGPRLGEMTTGGYTLIDIPTPRQRFIHIHPDPEELGRVYQSELPINASPRAFARAAGALAPIANPPWAAATAAAHEEYLTWRKPPRSPGDIQMGEVMLWLDAQLPPDAIVTNGAGNFATWVHRFHQYRRFGSQLAPTSGSMGYGFPAALAAKVVHPERVVVCVAGDGDFLMTGQELATAVHRKLGVIVLLVNNNMYGTIRMHQERYHPGRVIGTDLVNPDFAALARAYGAHGEVVERTADFAAAFERARAAGRPAILELRIDPEALTIRQSLSEIRAAALTPRG
ncbi:MAG TPA: thiamine pyrophosphate-binding protein [Stellaceae bacterium]